MKKPILLAALAALAISGIAIGAEGAKGKGKGGGSPAERAAMFIKNGDKDGDGKLDAAELTALFTDMDAKRAAGAPKKTT